jgi:hypothetical protein
MTASPIGRGRVRVISLPCSIASLYPCLTLRGKTAGSEANVWRN